MEAWRGSWDEQVSMTGQDVIVYTAKKYDFIFHPSEPRYAMKRYKWFSVRDRD